MFLGVWRVSLKQHFRMKSVEVIIVCPRYHASNLDVAPGSVHSRMTFFGKGIHVKPLFAAGILGGGSDPTFFWGETHSVAHHRVAKGGIFISSKASNWACKLRVFTKGPWEPTTFIFHGFWGVRNHFVQNPTKRQGKKAAGWKTQHLLKNYFTSKWSPPWHVGRRLSGEGCPRNNSFFAISHKVISCVPLIRRTPGKHIWKQQQRRMLKHAKTCQDTTCQTYQRNRNQTCQ